MGLGEALLARGYEIVGRELVDGFRKLSFEEKLVVVAHDLEHYVTENCCHVIANSFGAYVLLHTLARLPPFSGNVLLLSPIVGAFSNQDRKSVV